MQAHEVAASRIGGTRSRILGRHAAVGELLGDEAAEALLGELHGHREDDKMARIGHARAVEVEHGRHHAGLAFVRARHEEVPGLGVDGGRRQAENLHEVRDVAVADPAGRIVVFGRIARAHKLDDVHDVYLF